MSKSVQANKSTSNPLQKTRNLKATQKGTSSQNNSYFGSMQSKFTGRQANSPAQRNFADFNEEIALALVTLIGLGFLTLGILIYANPNDIQARIAKSVTEIAQSFERSGNNTRVEVDRTPRPNKMDTQYVKSGLIIHEKVDIARLVVLKTSTSNSGVEEKIYPITTGMLDNAIWNVENGKPYSLLERHGDLPSRLKSESDLQKERESLVALRAALLLRLE